MKTVGGTTGLTANVAVYEWFAVTLVSVREALVDPSDHWTKWNPLLATAVTADPVDPEFTV